MIDQWFKKDLENIFKKHSAAVFIDEFGEAQFLLKRVEKEYKVYIAFLFHLCKIKVISFQDIPRFDIKNR